MSGALEDKTADTPAPEGDEAQSEAPEQEATRMGWRPLEEFKGDPEKWVDADTFLKRGKEVLPIVRAENKQLTEALRRAEAKVDKLAETIKESRDFYSKVEQRAYERAKADLEQKLEDAADAGDTASVKRVTKEIVDLETEAAKKPAKEEAKPEQSAELTAWLEENPWFDTDKTMTIVATDYSAELGRQGVPVSKQWAMITDHIRKEFPHKFENPRRNGAPAVEGEGSTRAPRGKSWSDLPSDAKAQGDRFVKQGIVESREKYARDYWAQA